MAVTVTMPQLGETVTEGTILRWAKQAGDSVAEDEILLEVSTDKVDTEVPSPAAGVLQEILVPAGETVAVGTPLAIILGPGEAAAPAPAAAAEPIATEPAPPPAPAAPAPVPEPAPAPAAPAPLPEPVPAPAAPAPLPEPAPAPAAPVAAAPAAPPPQIEIVTEPAPAPAVAPEGAELGLLSPVVRKLAREHGIDLSLVRGTGREGRITRKDVQAYIDVGAVAAAPPAPAVAGVAAEPAPIPEPIPVATAPAPEPVSVAPPVPEPVPVAAAPEPAPFVAPAPEPAPAAPPEAVGPGKVRLRPGDRVEDLARLRSRIAEKMSEARRTAAHVWTVVEVDFERLEQVRQRHKAAFKEREGFSLTYLPFIARATIDALAAFPVVNSSFHPEEQQRIKYSRVELGIAVDLDQEGLIVMTIRGADGLRLRGLAREVRAVAGKARAEEYTLDDVTGSTFTITNPGPYGSLMSAPVINVPNVAILSTDTVVKRPVVVTDSDGNDAIAIHHVGNLGLSWDHRAFDGSTAVLFLRHIKEAIETWDWEHELT
jgi:2-oxoglutarate dehydrogenase E2 component (dihydrolipoamide succinyltransferase)